MYPGKASDVCSCLPPVASLAGVHLAILLQAPVLTLASRVAWTCQAFADLLLRLCRRYMHMCTSLLIGSRLDAIRGFTDHI